MKELSFKVMREMTGDKDYRTGDKRELSALDAIHLVRSGALEPANEEARKAMAELMNDTPEDRDGIVQRVKEDAPRNKDQGNAPANKGGRKGASGGKAAAKPAGGPATGTGSGDDGQGGGAGGEGGTGGEGGASTETQGASGDGTDTTNGGNGSTGATTGGATGAPPVAKKRR